MMESRVELVLGDMFDGPCDLIVFPCSTVGTVAYFVPYRLRAFNLPNPKSLMSLGEVDIREFNGANHVASYVAFAASVRDFSSTTTAIEEIGRKLGRFAKEMPSVQRISAPLLGAGAGGLQSELVVESLSQGFLVESPAASVLRIYVQHRDVFERIKSLPQVNLAPKKPSEEAVNDESIIHSEIPTVRVFISYTKFNQENADWVKLLATFLRNSGIDARLDVWHLAPGMDVAQWMCNEVEIADRVLLICSEEYARRADGRHGGVGWETRLIQGFLLQSGSINPKKFVPIVRTDNCDDGLPFYLKSSYCIHWPQTGTKEDLKQHELLECLFEIQEEAPEVKPPPMFIVHGLLKRRSTLRA